MRSRRFLLSLFASVLGLSLVFSGMCLDAAADEQYIRLSYNDFVAIAGDTVSGYYLADDQSLKPVTFTRETTTRYRTRYISSVDMDSAGASLAVNSYTVTYSCIVPDDVYMSSDSYVPFVQVDWNFHFSNVTYFGSGGLAYVNTLYSTLSRQGLAQYNYLILGSTSSSVVPLAGRANDSNLAGYMHHNNDLNNTPFTSGCYSVYSGGASDIYIGTQYFSNLVTDSNRWYVSIICPVLNPDYVFVGRDAPPAAPSSGPSWDGDGISSGSASGSIVDKGDGTQDISVTVETDNTGLIGGILSGIKNLFVPTDEDLQGFTDDMHTLAQDHLGGLYEAVDILDDSFSGLSDLSARQSIHVDPVTIPLLGSDTMTFGNWDVPLKPSTTGGFALLYDGIALLADFIAAFAFLRMCRNKLDIILNPAAEVVQE